VRLLALLAISLSLGACTGVPSPIVQTAPSRPDPEADRRERVKSATAEIIDVIAAGDRAMFNHYVDEKDRVGHGRAGIAMVASDATRMGSCPTGREITVTSWRLGQLASS
jgi:hypothetical protein